MSNDVADSRVDDEGDLSTDEVEDALTPDPSPARVTYTTTDFDVEGLVRRLSRGDIVIPTFGEDLERDQEPIETARFQRPFVWTKNQMDRFIESLLLGYPIPGIFLVQQQDRRYLVLDGQQRLRTLAAFYAGIVNKREFSLQNVAKEYKGLRFETLDDEQRRQLSNTFIQATIVQPNGTIASLDAVYQVFERLNAGGTQLTPHEIRTALYAGELVGWLTELTNSNEWRSVYGPPARHLRDQELVLRIIALMVAPGTYKRPLKKFLNDFMAEHRNLEGLEPDDLQARFRRAAELIAEGPGAASLRPSGPAINAALTEAVFVGVMRNLEAQEMTADDVTTGLNRLLAEEELAGVTQFATADQDSVRKRLALATRSFALQ